MRGTLRAVAPRKDEPVAVSRPTAPWMVESHPGVLAFPCWVSAAPGVAGCGASSASTWLSGEAEPPDHLHVLAVTVVKRISLDKGVFYALSKSPRAKRLAENLDLEGGRNLIF